MGKIQLLIEIEERLYKNIIDNDKDDEEFEAMDDAFNNAKPLPKDATNGDIIKAMFPSMETFRTSDFVEIRYKVHDEVWCVSALDIVWWDKPYKRGEEGETDN